MIVGTPYVFLFFFQYFPYFPLFLPSCFCPFLRYYVCKSIIHVFFCPFIFFPFFSVLSGEFLVLFFVVFVVFCLVLFCFVFYINLKNDLFICSFRMWTWLSSPWAGSRPCSSIPRVCPPTPCCGCGTSGSRSGRTRYERNGDYVHTCDMINDNAHTTTTRWSILLVVVMMLVLLMSPL